jgi:hypothetical protein
MRRRRCITFWASAWLFQKVGLEVIFSISANCSSSLATSKMPPQLCGPPIQVVMAT